MIMHLRIGKPPQTLAVEVPIELYAKTVYSSSLHSDGAASTLSTNTRLRPMETVLIAAFELFTI